MPEIDYKTNYELIARAEKKQRQRLASLQEENDLLRRALHLTVKKDQESENKSVQQKLAEERAELEAKIKNLCNFINSQRYNSLNEIQKNLLKSQAEFMKGYSLMLKCRFDDLNQHTNR